MQKVSLIIVSVVLTAFLTQAQAQETPCPDKKPKAEVTIEYGDAKIVAVPATVEVCHGGKIEFALAPDDNYEIVEVKLKPTDGDQEWLKKRFRAVDLKEKNKEGKKKFKIDVPEGTPDDIYKYYVIVSDVGQLDPRIDVLP